MRKIILTPTYILIIFLILLFFFFFKIGTEAGGKTKIDLEYLTIYEIGASHTPGGDRSGGSQLCQVGGGNLDGDCPVGTPCTCDAQMQEGYYYRIEFQIANDGATTDSMWGYYNDLTNLNGAVSTASDVWVTDGGADETCSSATWSAGRLTWPEADGGCDLSLIEDEVGNMEFIIQIGSGASDTSGADLYGEEDTSGDNLTGGVEITVAAAAEVSCSVSATSTDFSLLTADAVSTSTPNINALMSCTYTASGCTLSVQGTGSSTEPGLWNSVDSHLIASADASLSPGTEGYGIQATSSDGGWTLNPKYVVTSNQVGGLTIAMTTLASSTTDITTSTATVTHKAARSVSTPTGSYQDTIIYSCTIN